LKKETLKGQAQQKKNNDISHCDHYCNRIWLWISNLQLDLVPVAISQKKDLSLPLCSLPVRLHLLGFGHFLAND
jgi:hypothetical protein